jgi:hypothetical protein
MKLSIFLNFSLVLLSLIGVLFLFYFTSKKTIIFINNNLLLAQEYLINNDLQAQINNRLPKICEKRVF